ncbi:Peptidase-S8 domain-containing protein [Fusarium sp. LHS14.1]|nr:Peptidase-S8 domain-containing protein [Fusarium sp. LHS14.1]
MTASEPPEDCQLVSVTKSPGWNCLQTLGACMSGRLGRFSRLGKPHGRPKKRGNDAALIEMDLDPILRAAPRVVDVTKEAFDEMDRTALNLLRSLNTMANLQLTMGESETTSPNSSGEPEISSREEIQLVVPRESVDKVVALGDDFARLHKLMSFLASLSTLDDQRQFSLATGPHPLFILPPGDTGDLAIGRLRRWNEISKTLFGGAQSREDCSFVSPEQTTEQLGCGVLYERWEERVAGVVESIFEEFRQLSCVKNTTHEIRLQVSEDLYSGRPGCQQNLDMFVSCCPGGNLIWQKAQCGDFPVRAVAKECICDSISRAMRGRRMLHILVDCEGLFDVTESLPAVHLPCDSFDGSSLSELLRQDVFKPIDVQAYLDKTAETKFDSATKAQVALGLSRCLMDFFDKGLELASYSWVADNVHFRELPPSPKAGKRHLLYVSLRSNLDHDVASDMAKMFNSGNPVVLSFAKLLLEILDGKAINISIKPQGEDNILSWSELGDVVERMLRDRGGDPFASQYLEVVENCLGLWATLRSFDNRTDLSATSRFIRKVIYERVVHKLQRIANFEQTKRNGSSLNASCEQRKRKTKDSMLDQSPAKKQSFVPQSRAGPTSLSLVDGHKPGESPNEAVAAAEEEQFTDPAEEDSGGYGRSSLYDDQGETSQSDRIAAKGYLNDLAESTKRYIEPLTQGAPSERRPIKLAIIDSGIDLDNPRIRDRKHQVGDTRNWTSDQPNECDDGCGHGTHVTRLVLEVAPAVEVYVAKVSQRKKFDSKVSGQIAQAIEWATSVWNVDIISLSIGMDGEDDTIKKALDNVLDPPRDSPKKVVVIAAASNWGGNRHIAFPACYEDIICVHSTDGFGNPSKTNPTPQKGKDFAVLGMSIKSSSKGKDKKRMEEYISGTSYATAIGAGIAANVLDFASRDPKLWDDEKGWLYSSWGMSRVFRRMSEERRGYRYVTPWRLFDGRPEEEVWRDIRRALKESV